MSQIEYFDLNHASPELKAMLRTRRAINMYRMLAHGDGVAIGFMQFGDALRNKVNISPALRELVILRTAALTGGHYEIHKHKWWANKHGISDAKISAILDNRNIDVTVLDEKECATIKFIDELVQNGKASETTLQHALSFYTKKEIFDILMLSGFYLIVGRFVDTFGVEIENEDWDYTHNNEHFKMLL